MKILYPVEVFYPSQAGGPANSVYWITKNLASNGLAVTVVASDRGLSPDLPRDTWTDVGGARTKYVTTPRPHFPIRQTLAAFREVFANDIIHISSVFYPVAFSTAILARLLRKSLVWSPRGELDPLALRHSSGRKRPVLAILRLVIGRYALFHSTCDEETAYIRKLFGERAEVAQIPNYLELPEPVNRESGNYILFIGRIHPKKGIDNLIEAIALSPTFRSSRCELKIAGTGEHRFELPLRKLAANLGIADRVRFIGQIEGDEKQHLFANARFTVMPSHTENFGVVVLESLAQGTPVISSRGAPWSVLEEAGVGRWVDNDPQNLANAIEDLLNMPDDQYLEKRARCRPFVERRFNIEDNISKWLDLYRSSKRSST